jgi:hypothetical protein
MKRLLFVVLMMFGLVSWAEWEYAGTSNLGTDYHDKSTIRRSGKIAKMWTMKDYFEERTSHNGKVYKSAKGRVVFNCLEDTFAIISLLEYSSSMGKGEIIFSDDTKENEWDWGSIPPGSSVETHFKIACGKK